MIIEAHSEERLGELLDQLDGLPADACRRCRTRLCVKIQTLVERRREARPAVRS